MGFEESHGWRGVAVFKKVRMLREALKLEMGWAFRPGSRIDVSADRKHLFESLDSFAAGYVLWYVNSFAIICSILM